MLRNGHPLSTPLFGSARYRPNKSASSMRLLISLENIFHSRAHSSRAATPHPVPCGSLVQRCAPSHATPPPSPRRTPSPAAPASSSLLCAAPSLLRAMPCPPRAPRCSGVLSTSSEGRGRRDAQPQQGDCCDERACLKCFRRFRGMFVWMLQK